MGKNSFLLTFSVSILLSLSASLSLAQNSCHELYEDMNPRFLQQDGFTDYILEAKGTRRELVKKAGAIFEQRKIRFTIENKLGLFPKLIISTEGRHPINRMAKRLFDMEGTQLVYNPRELTDGINALFEASDNAIYISHLSAQTGKLDGSFFHELRHWSLTRKSRDGKSPYTNSEVSKDKIGRFPFEPKSIYNGLFSFEELPVWAYELKLQTLHHVHQFKNNRGNLMFDKDYRFTIEESLSIASDIRRFAEYFMQKLKEEKMHIAVMKDGEMVEMKLEYRFKRYSIFVPMKQFDSLNAMNKDQQEEFALAYLKKVDEITALYMKTLEAVEMNSRYININTRNEEMIGILERNYQLLAPLD